MPQSILIVDDEKDILEFLSYNLKNEGYKVFQSRSGEEAIKITNEINPDLIILDIMMGGINGIETCHLLRKKENLKDTLIVFLTARNEDFSEIAAFEAGADDYIYKPIKPRVFLSRIQAILKRVTNQEKQKFGNLEIDYDSMQIKVDGKEQTLRKKEFLLLKLLTSKPGKVLEEKK